MFKADISVPLTRRKRSWHFYPLHGNPATR